MRISVWSSDVCASDLELFQPLDARFLLGRIGRNAVDHPCPGKGCDRVRADAEALHVDRDRLRKTDDAEFGGGIIGLAEIADEPARRGHMDIGARALRLEEGGGEIGRASCREGVWQYV